MNKTNDRKTKEIKKKFRKQAYTNWSKKLPAPRNSVSIQQKLDQYITSIILKLVIQEV